MNSQVMSALPKIQRNIWAYPGDTLDRTPTRPYTRRENWRTANRMLDV